MKKSDFTILLDNGHGVDTPGKCSPDCSHYEYLWARQCANALAVALLEEGFNVKKITPEAKDIRLSKRVERANYLCSVYSPCILISIHNNAAGSDGKWHSASGFSVFVSNNASKRSKELASIFTDIAKARGLTGNRFIPPAGYWQQNLAICRDTVCPAVLTENMFQDNRGDVKFLQSEEGLNELVRLHLDAIKIYYDRTFND